jgi:hypothetical protein
MSRSLTCVCYVVLLSSAVGCTDDGTHSNASQLDDAGRARSTSEADAAGPPAEPTDAGASDARDASALGMDAQSAPADAQAPAKPHGAEAAGTDARNNRMDAGKSDSPPRAGAGGRVAEPPATLDAGAAAEPPLSCAPFARPTDCAEIVGSTLPVELRCAGLYADIARGQLACGFTEYTPAFELWSDGAAKQRWVSLPAGAAVDTRDPDGFVFPVGTEFWKEFRVSLNGQLRRAETRLLRKVERGWVLATYVWSEDGRSATATNNGVANWQGSGHTVPNRDQCVECHAGRGDLVLGWDPILLGPGARGVHFEDLISAGMTDQDAGVAPSAALPPGDAIEQAALGYLHVNCGVSCHNPSREARARDTALYLRLSTGRADGVLQTPAVTTAINKLPTGNAPFYELPEPDAGQFYDLLPGSPERSLMLARMLVRDHPAQMPPLASNKVDTDGAAAVSAWIQQMTPERGYPVAVP